MQNFTLGKKGYVMLLFALALLIGSSPTFAQTCPTVTASAQSYCNALSTVSDLKPMGATWYADETSNTPLPSNELLMNGEDYYADSESCTTSRTNRKVTVSLTGAILAPTVQDDFFTPCSGGGPYNIADLKEAIDASAAPSGYTLEIFPSRYGKADAPLANNASISKGNYYAGFYDGTNCQSQRKPVRFEPVDAPAPAAPSPQTVCEGTTISELEAEGTNLWYRTETSQPALPNDYVVQNNENYWATQIVPSDGPPCESAGRTEVRVTVEPAAFNESVQRFCESIGEGNNFRKPQVQDLSPQGGTWYADENSVTPLDPSTELIEDQDYFNRDNGNECSQDRVVVEFFPTPNAGSTTSVPVCSNDDSFNLVDEIRDSQLGPPQQTGTFSPALSTGTNIFNPADYEPGSYNFRYIVEGNEDCPTDESRITVVVEAAPNAGEDTPLVFCQNEFQALAQQIFANPEQAEATFASLIGDDVDTAGDFTNDDLETIANNYMAAVQANAFPFNAQSTYTVTNENGCSDSSLITLTVNQSPNAGENGSVEVSRKDAPFNLITELGSPQSGGSWAPGNPDGTFNPATGDSGVYTYTVTNEFECTDSATVTVTILEECPIVEETTQSFCESISDPNGNNPRRPRVNDLIPSGATWYATADSEEPLPGNTILTDGTTYYAGNSGGTCESRTPVLVNIDDSPNAGRTTNITVCGADEPFDLLDRYNPSILGAPDAGGTIIPTLASGTTIFDPSVDAARQYTYRVESTNNGCPDDTSRITVNITEPTNANAGENVEESFCSNEGIINLFTLIPDGVNTNGVFEGFENGQFDTAANIGDNEIIYTVDDEEGCVIAGSATYTITVFEAPNAGPGADLNFCITEIQEMSTEEALAIFENLIPDDVTDGGDFSTSINDLIIEFTANPIGEFSTTYAVSNENCTDSATYSVTISDAEDADAGSDVDDLVFCSTDADLNLNNFLSDDALQNGYFGELENGIFSPSTVGVGIYTFTFTVDSSSDCVTGSDSAIYTVEVIQGPKAGDDSSVTLSTEQDPVNLFNYINGNPDTSGVFTPGNPNGDLDPSNYTPDDYTFTYTVTSSNGCSDSSELAVTITNEVICPVIQDTTQEFCESISDASGNNPRRPQVRDLMPLNITWYASADSIEALPPTETLLDNQDYFAGNANGDCPNRERVIVKIDDSPNAGRTTNITVCSDDEPFDLVSRINPSILGTPDAGGTFSPALASGTNIFDPSVDAARQYKYTVQSTNEACPADDTRVTVNIFQSGVANAGDIADQTVCSSDDSIILSGFLTGSGATLGGKFSGEGVNTEGTMFDPSKGPNPDGYTITYTVNTSTNPCVTGEATSTFIITVTDPLPANAGDIADQTVCSSDEIVMLVGYLNGSGATPGGKFFGNGVNAEGTMFDPSVGPNTDGYTITYKVNEDDLDACVSGEATSTFIITVTDPADAPTSEASQSFCLIDNPTVGDIIVTGENVVIYSNADLAEENVADVTTALISGMSYYAVSTNDAGSCSSEAIEITVTITDPSAPSLQTDGNEFCRSDNPTVQDLINNFNESGVLIYTSSTGGSVVAASTALQNGVTYYGASVDGTSGCESTERLAVIAKVEFCGIPEGFSPNGDGINDRFVIPDIAVNFPNYTIEIFNRYGNVVFKGNASTPDWDGISNESGTLGNDVLPVGVYFYILNYNDGQTSPVQGKLYLSI